MFVIVTTSLASPIITIGSGKDTRIKVLCNTGMACREGDYTFSLCEQFCNDNQGPNGWHAVCQAVTQKSLSDLVDCIG
ncbi:unnamed protein product [Lactuca virosa]|uniref:Uncharacterized protein n=1 Tax=Lactuca virosa TaxID=75947 RepID=A0AAU9NE43_9ASTR|nr:unnamed protein product [Lactuca virosa]